jgi:hypothetical protein
MAMTHARTPNRALLSTFSAVGLLAGCVLCWWARLFSAEGTRVDLVNQDALVYWVPLLREVSRQWREGLVPLWNPYQAFGTPLLADPQAAALYPLQVPYLLLAAGPAWAVTIVCHHIILLLGAWWVCRELNLSRTAALVGAANLGFAGLVMEAAHDQPAFVTLCWLPVVFACAIRLASQPGKRAAAALAGAWAMQILAGYPQTIAYSGCLVLAWLAVTVLAAARSNQALSLRIMGWAVAVLVLTACLTAAQLLPTLELLSASVRAPGQMTAAQQAYLAANPRELLSAAQGVLPLALAGLGLWRWTHRRAAWFLAVCGTMVLLLATGPATPLFDLLHLLPAGTWLRGIRRILPLWCLCTAVLSAAGVQVLLERRTRSVPIARELVVCAVVAACARALDLAGGPTAAKTVGIFLELCLPTLLAIAVRCSGPRLSRAILVAGCIGVAAVPQALFHPGVSRLSPFQISAIYESRADLFDRISGPWRTLSLLRPPHWEVTTWAMLGTYFRRPVLGDREPLTTRDFEAFVAALRGVPVDRSDVGVFIGDIIEPPHVFEEKLLNLSGVRAILLAPREARKGLRWFSPRHELTLRFETAGAALYENAHAAPRAFFVPESGRLPAGASCVGQLTKADFDPLSRVVLDQGSAAERPNVSTEENRSTAQVRLTEINSAELAIDVQTEQSGLVVLTDAHYPGWVARVNGQESPIQRADCFFRAVRVEPGASRVEFRYEPRSFRIGVLVSALGVMTLATLVWRPRPAHR